MELLTTWCGMIAFVAAVLYGIEVAREEEMEEEDGETRTVMVLEVKKA